jgi:serine/threonine protein kinase/WD40 repeat protein
MTPGTTISHYRITGEIGRGGMGIVYKAEDTKLDRTVALKLLPPHALVSADDKARFYREARAAAALNHPNIAHVYEIDEGEVAAGDVRPFIAMEFIDGETLADRVAKGPLPLKDVVSIATQMAEGLKAAHKKDVVHRDVKSGNIMLTTDGVVKVLDFGLAKTTASTKLTQMGSTLGTVAYMSPEQARGEEVDRRSDIWSLGVILYEMITGQLPFRGDYEQAVVYGILNEDPESMTTLRAGVPMALDGIIGKLLAKDPDLRYQNVDELPSDLKRIDISASQTTRISTGSRSVIAPSPALGSAAMSGTAIAEPVAEAPRRFPWVAVMGAAVAAAMITAAVFLVTRPKPPPPEISRYYMQLDPAPTVSIPRLSADGSTLAFSSGAPTVVHVKARGEYESRPLLGTEGANGFLEFSPDGRWLLFQVGSTWKRILVSGEGRPVDITTIDGQNFGGDWLSNEEVVFSANEGLIRHSLATGQQQFMTKSDSSHLHIFPNVIRSGKEIVFGNYSGNLDSASVAVLSVETGDVKTVIDRATVAAYMPSGHLLFSRDTAPPLTLFAVPFDIERQEVVGTPVPVLEGSTWFSSAWSAEGRLILAGANPSNDSRLIWIDRDGKETPFVDQEAVFQRVRISPDGRQVAVSIEDVSAPSRDLDLWIYDDRGQAASQLTFEHINENHVWMPDGQYLAFESNRSGSPTHIYYQKADGSEPAAQLAVLNLHLHPWSFSPDGSLLTDATDQGQIVLVSPADGTSEVILDTDGVSEDAPTFSPDGKWIAYVTDELGTQEVFVSTFPPSGAKWRISVDGGASPIWAPDGQTLYYRSGSSMMAAQVQTSPAFRRVGVPEVLFDKIGIIDGDLHPDGNRFLLIVRATAVEASARVRVVENWFEELKQIAPTGD